MKDLFRLLTCAAIAAGFLAFPASGDVRAAIVTTITDGTTTVTLTSSTNILFGMYSIDGYTGNVDVVSTNFPGNTVQGTLTTTTTVNNVTSSTPATLTITSGVYTDTTGTTLANFTAPAGASLGLKNDVTAAGFSLGSTGTLTGTSFGNGTPTPSATVLINTTTEAMTTATFAGQSGTGYYTLTNTSVISGLTLNDASLSLAVASTVTGVPEPSTLVASLIALPIVGLAAWRRKRNKKV